MPGPCINIQEDVGFGDVLARGRGVKIIFSRSKGCHFCQVHVFWEFTDEMLTLPSTPALLFSVHLRKK